MIRRVAFLIFTLLLSSHSINGETPLTINELKPTVLFPNKKPLCQIALLQIYNNDKRTSHCEISVQMEGKECLVIPKLIDIPPAFSEHELLIPDLNTSKDLYVEIRNADDGSFMADHRETWQPQRHWKVFIIRSSPEDLGYEDYIYKKQHDIANFIDLAHDMQYWGGSKRPSHYTLESLLFMRNYIEEWSEAEWRKLVEKEIKPENERNLVK